jgi:hypothetical protein
MGIFQRAADSEVPEVMGNPSPLRILIIVEATYVSGSAKAVLEFAREAVRRNQTSRCAEISIVVFLRNETENTFTRSAQAIGIPLEAVTERRAFDWRIVPQLRAIATRVKPDIIWTNAVKAHFLVSMAGLHRRAKWVAFHHGYTTTTLRTRLYNQLDRWSLKRAERVVTVCGELATEMVGLGIPRDRIQG